MSLIDSLHWRYAAKKMTGEKVSEENLSAILEATQLSASSYGLQPYTILVVTNPEVKAKLQAAAYGQPQLVQSSHVLIFCVPEKIKEEDVSAYMQAMATKRGMPVEALKGFNDTIVGTIKSLSDADQQIWSAKQAYIALGTALAAAAELKVDACPMEGFDRKQFDEILGLKEKGLLSSVLMPIGFRSPEDQLANAPKVRKEKNILYQFVD